MNYQTFVDKLNEKELIEIIERALKYNVDVFVDVKEDYSVTNRFNVTITLVIEEMAKFFSKEENYLFKVDLDYNDVYEDSEVTIPIDYDQMLRKNSCLDCSSKLVAIGVVPKNRSTFIFFLNKVCSRV